MSSSKFKIDNKDLLRALGIAQTTRGRQYSGFHSSQHSFFQESDSGFGLEMTKQFDQSIIAANNVIEDEDQESQEDIKYRGEFLFSLDIDISHDKKDSLAVYTNDKPFELAKSFCDKHGIEHEIADIIAARIVENAKQTLINRETLMNGQLANEYGETDDEERVTYNENQILPKGGDDSVDDVYSPSIRNYKSKIMSEKETNFESAAKRAFNDIKEMKPYEVFTSGVDEGHSRFIGSTKDTQYKTSTFTQEYTEEETISPSPIKSQSQSKTTTRDRFYEKTLRDIENRTRKDAMMTEMHNEEKYKECTFHPTLNPISLKLAGNRKRDVSTEDQLLVKGKITEEKRMMIRQDAKAKENRNNTFRPEVNNMSKCLEEKNRPDYDQKERFEDLYQEYKVLHEKRNQLKMRMSKEYPFAPNICHTKRDDKDGPNFLERLADDIEKRKTKKANEEEELQESLPTFYPKILKTVSDGSRNAEKLPVGEYLYKMANEIDNKKGELREAFEKELREKAPKCTGKSAQIIQEKMTKNLQYIFEVLDADKDGLISTEQINPEVFPKDLSITLEPILNGLKSSNCQQNVNQFLEACFELLKTADPVLKSFLALDFSKRHTKDRNELLQEREQAIGMVFHPKINQNAKEMAGHGEQRQERSVYQRLFAEREKSEVRLKELKEKKEKEEMRECSFRPVVNKYPGGTETYYQKVFAGLETSP